MRKLTFERYQGFVPPVESLIQVSTQEDVFSGDIRHVVYHYNSQRFYRVDMKDDTLDFERGTWYRGQYTEI